MDETQRVREEVPDQAYFAIIPHIVDELLGPYEYRLYGHYRRVCGEGSRGRCYEKTATTAEKTGMSVGKIAQARRILEDLGMIRVHQRKVRNLIRTDVTMLDLWPVNMEYFTVQDVNDGVQRSPHERYRSLYERYRSPHERYRSPHERLKNNLGKEELREEELREEELVDDDGGSFPLTHWWKDGVNHASLQNLGSRSLRETMRNYANEIATLNNVLAWDGQHEAIAALNDEDLILLVEWQHYLGIHYDRLVVDEKLTNPVGFILSNLAKHRRPGITTKQRNDLQKDITHYAQQEAMP